MAGLAGCESGSKGPVAQTPEQRAAAVPAQGDTWDKLGYRLQWRSFAMMAPGAEVKFCKQLDDVLVTQDSASMLTVIEASSGQRRWSDQVGSPLIRFYGAFRTEKKLIASSESEVFFFDIETGDLADKQKLAEVATTGPAAFGDVAAYGTASNVVLGHHLASGYRLWGVLMNAPMETAPIMVGNDGIVAMVSRAGDVAFANVRNGASNGRNKMFDGTDAELAASESTMFVASRDQSLYAFGREGGIELWRIRTESPLRWTPTYHAGRVYCDMGADGMSAVDSRTGKILWNNPGVKGEAVAMNKGQITVFDGEHVSVIDSKNGKVIVSAKVDNVSKLVAEKFEGGSLYAVAANGVIGKLTPKP